MDQRRLEEDPRFDLELGSLSATTGSDIYQRLNSLLDSDRDQECDSSYSDCIQGCTSHVQHPVSCGRGPTTSTPLSVVDDSQIDIGIPHSLNMGLHRYLEGGSHSMPCSPMFPRRQLHHRIMCRGDSPVSTDTSLSSLMNSMNVSGNQNTVGQTDSSAASYSSLEPIQSTINKFLQQQKSLQDSLFCLLRHRSTETLPSSTLYYGGSSTGSSGDGNGNSLERAARFHRTAAAVHDAIYSWSGNLPCSLERNPIYSCKVFLGGVPWDLTEDTLKQVFSLFGPVKVEWPGKEQHVSQPRGYVYLIFESEKQVKNLLDSCSMDCEAGPWFYRISSRRMKSKEVQVIPWVVTDCNFARSSFQKLDPQKTVFVGALHGMITAESLAKIMNDLFDGVVYAGIDTDKFKYPIGSARVTFSSTKSYMKAVAAAFIEIKTPKFCKKIQVDPYLEDSLCSLCQLQQGPYFCREMICFRYFCRHCWQWHHAVDCMKSHKPLMRNSKTMPILGFNQGFGNNFRSGNQ